MRNLASSLFVLFFLFGCTRSMMHIPSELLVAEAPDESFQNVEKRSSLENVRAEIRNSELSCNPGSCPDGIALITSVGQTNHEDPDQKYFALDSCTGVFTRLPGDKGVEQLYVVTAGHCIPKRLQNSGAACADDISIKVMKGAQLRCESVDFVSTPSSEKFVSRFDLALLKVSTNVEVSTYELSQKPLKDSTQPYQVKMFSVDPQSENGKFKIRETECWYMQNSYILPHSVEGTAPLMMTRGCSLISGNSGAPLLDGATIVGIQSNFVQYEEKVVADGAVTVASNPYCFDANLKKMRCQSELDLVLVDQEGSFDLPSYLRLLRSRDSRYLDAKTKKALAILSGDSKVFDSYKKIPGFSSSISVYDFKSSNNAYIRVVFPSCYQPQGIDSNLAHGVQLSDYNVISYALSTRQGKNSESKFKLGLDYSIFRPIMILQKIDDGTFRLSSSVFYNGYEDIRIARCR